MDSILELQNNFLENATLDETDMLSHLLLLSDSQLQRQLGLSKKGLMLALMVEFKKGNDISKYDLRRSDLNG